MTEASTGTAERPSSFISFKRYRARQELHSLPTRRSSDLFAEGAPVEPRPHSTKVDPNTLSFVGAPHPHHMISKESRSEERRVGKESRSRWRTYQEQKKKEITMKTELRAVPSSQLKANNRR